MSVLIEGEIGTTFPTMRQVFLQVVLRLVVTPLDLIPLRLDFRPWKSSCLGSWTLWVRLSRAPARLWFRPSERVGERGRLRIPRLARVSSDLRLDIDV